MLIIKGEWAFIINLILSFLILFFNTKVFDFRFFTTHNPIKDEIFISSSFNNKYFIYKTVPVFIVLLYRLFMFFLLLKFIVVLIKIFLKFSDIKQPFVIANMYDSRSKVTIILA